MYVVVLLLRTLFVTSSSSYRLHGPRVNREKACECDYGLCPPYMFFYCNRQSPDLVFIKVEGFGVTIGRAVALLHVVRHGLRSQELWSLLAALKESTSAQEKVWTTAKRHREVWVGAGWIGSGFRICRNNFAHVTRYMEPNVEPVILT